MDIVFLLIIYSIAILAISLVGGVLPFLRDWTSVQLHLFTGFSAGVFISASLLTMIPEAVSTSNAKDALTMVLLAFIVVLFIERVILYQHRDTYKEEEEECEHDHLITSTTAFVGLSVHAAVDGFLLGAAAYEDPAIGIIVFLAILAHKGIEVFSLSTTFRLAGFNWKRGLTWVLVFALISPVAAWISIPFIQFLGTIELGIPLALAGGTFLYVGIYDLLPEAFHLEEKRYSAYLAVILGILTMYLIGLVVD